MNSYSNTCRCNVCLERMRPEQIISHLASIHHIKERDKLEKNLHHSLNSIKPEQRIPSLLGSWMIDMRDDDHAIARNRG